MIDVIDINEIKNLEEVSGGKSKILKKMKEKNITFGDIVSIPLRVPMYVIGANVAGLVLGAYEGFGNVWYTSHPEKRWAESNAENKNYIK